ncbi:DUF7344 domain-containing protein [Halomicrococcus sp. NG-SE-24]|uniref:DUF7344 domain-containing protein n=1 Tax=Halomicrococcus sp. NG-SE-24 TaxID=3436928 RepID=UPI003D990644
MTPHSPSANEEVPKHSVDEICRLLVDAHRRHVLYYLEIGSTKTATLDELVAYLCEAIGDFDTPQQVRTRLVHQHLPYLADYNVIEYDQRSETVRYREKHHIAVFLTLAARYEDSI